MKRSEMIQKAAEEFVIRESQQQYRGYSHEGLAEEFLAIFEALGMLPPEQCDICPKEDIDSDLSWHTWEPEDEK